jgi:hypothetical protein
MKKLFTLFACASLAFTLSAQDSEQAAGSKYLTLNVSSVGGAISPTIGYALIDNLVFSGNLNGGVDGFKSLTFDLNTRYYINDLFLQVITLDVINVGINNLSIGVGNFLFLDAISDKLYIESSLNYDLNSGIYTSVGIGARF